MKYTVTPTISTSQYASGDVIGGKMTLKGAIARERLLVDIVVFDGDNEGVQIDFFFFSTDLVGTYTDNAAFSVNASDQPYLVGVASVSTGDYIAAGSEKIGRLTPVNMVFQRKRTDDLFVIAVVRGTPTFASTSDLRFEFGFLE